MPTKPNKAGQQQPYIAESGEYTNQTDNVKSKLGYQNEQVKQETETPKELISKLNDTSYQGKDYSKAPTTNIKTNEMYETAIKLINKSPKVAIDEEEELKQLESVKNNPDGEITIYRATIGDTINDNDWVFLSRTKAERWTRTPFGTPKPNVKVLEKKVKAKDVEWTGKNLEFVYFER